MNNQKIYDRACKGCIYLTFLNGYVGCCNYLFQVGKRRPCPPGKDCTAKETKKRKKEKKDGKS